MPDDKKCGDELNKQLTWLKGKIALAQAEKEYWEKELAKIQPPEEV